MYFLLKESFRHLWFQYNRGVVLFNNTYPIYVNHEALSILILCDGKNDINSISRKLAQLYNENYVVARDYVEEFIMQNVSSGMIEKIENPLAQVAKIDIFGSKEYWTPLYLILELTYKCPLLCTHCFLSAGNGKNIGNNLLYGIINDIITLNIRNIQLTGGEPMLHPMFDYTVKELVKNNIIVHISTSGYLNNSIEKVKCLAHGKGIILVSLDGLKGYHNYIRGKEDAYDRTIDFIKRLIYEDIIVKISTCIVDQPENEIVDLCNLVKQLGAQSIRFGFVDSIGRAKENNLFISEGKVENYKKFINELKTELETDIFKIEMNDVCEIKENSLFRNCGCGYNMLKINPLGEISECILSDKIIGTISDKDRLYEIIRHNAGMFHANSERVAPNSKLCGDCSNLHKCMGCIVRGRTSNCAQSYLFR